MSVTHPMMACGHTANATNGYGQPCCAICVGINPGSEQIADAPNLTGRTARCTCGRTAPSDVSGRLAFFEFRGPGSRVATDTCKHCCYYECTHDPEYMARNVPSNPLTVVQQGKCPGFEPHGAFEFDHYYCGCRGWD